MRYFSKFPFLCTWLPPSALGVIAGSAGAKELSYSSFLQLLWMSHSHSWVPCKHSPVSTKWSSTWLIARPQGFPSIRSFPQIKIKQRWSDPVPSQNPETALYSFSHTAHCVQWLKHLVGPSVGTEMMLLFCCQSSELLDAGALPGFAGTEHSPDAGAQPSCSGISVCFQFWSLCFIVGATAGSIQWWPQNINRSNIFSVSKTENWEGCCQSLQVAAILLWKPCRS